MNNKKQKVIDIMEWFKSYLLKFWYWFKFWNFGNSETPYKKTLENMIHFLNVQEKRRNLSRVNKAIKFIVAWQLRYMNKNVKRSLEDVEKTTSKKIRNKQNKLGKPYAYGWNWFPLKFPEHAKFFDLTK